MNTYAHVLAHRILGAFRPERCMWGSDFPCELWIPKSTYAGHLRLFQEELGLSPAAQEAILAQPRSGCTVCSESNSFCPERRCPFV